VRGRLPLFSSSGVLFSCPFSAALLFDQNRCDWSINIYWPIPEYIGKTLITHQKLVILTKQAIVLVNVGFGEYNGADRLYFCFYGRVEKITQPQIPQDETLQIGSRSGVLCDILTCFLSFSLILEIFRI
jgi:hypothetical protein